MKKLLPYFLIFLLHNVASNNLVGMDVPQECKSDKPRKQLRALTSEQISDYFQQGTRLFLAIKKGELPPQLYNLSYKCFVRAARYDHAAALFNVGVFNEYGLGKEKNLKIAVSFYTRARECGYPNDDEITYALALVKQKMENNVFY